MPWRKLRLSVKITKLQLRPKTYLKNAVKLPKSIKQYFLHWDFKMKYCATLDSRGWKNVRGQKNCSRGQEEFLGQGFSLYSLPRKNL